MSTDRRSVSIRMRADLLDALDETAEEIVYSRSRLIELAVEAFLERMDLPSREAPTSCEDLCMEQCIGACGVLP